MIKIVSDTGTMYSKKEGKLRNIEIAPLSVTIDERTYKEIEEINTDEFVDIINAGHIPVSSQPPIGDVIEIYEKLKEHEIINITLADGLSGTYNTACSAKNMVKNSDNITVINSKTLCGPQQYLVNLANVLVEKGMSVSEIKNEIEDNAKYSLSFLIPNDFEYLVRGGRLSPLVGKIGSLIKLVPVMIVTEDGKRIDKFTTKRTLKKAVTKICEFMTEKGVDTNYRIYISHSINEKLAQDAKEIITSCIKNVEVEINKLTPAFTTQGGPGCLSIQSIKKNKYLN